MTTHFFPNCWVWVTGSSLVSCGRQECSANYVFKWQSHSLQYKWLEKISEWRIFVHLPWVLKYLNTLITAIPDMADVLKEFNCPGCSPWEGTHPGCSPWEGTCTGWWYVLHNKQKCLGGSNISNTWNETVQEWNCAGMEWGCAGMEWDCEGMEWEQLAWLPWWCSVSTTSYNTAPSHLPSPIQKERSGTDSREMRNNQSEYCVVWHCGQVDKAFDCRPTVPGSNPHLLLHR